MMTMMMMMITIIIINHICNFKKTSVLFTFNLREVPLIWGNIKGTPGENCSFKCCLENFNITLFHEILDIENVWGVEDTGIFRGVQTYYFHISLPFRGVTGSPRFAMPLFSAVFKLLHFSKEPPSQASVYPPHRPSASLHHLFLVPSLFNSMLTSHLIALYSRLQKSSSWS